MGGTIKIAVRLHDGTITADTRWTNSFPGWLNAIEMVDDDHEYLKKFAYHDSEWRDGDHRVSPTSYGMIVIDATTHTIYSGNGYSTPGRSDAVMIMRRTDEPHWQEMRDRGLLHLYDGNTKERLTQYYDPAVPRNVYEESREIWGIDSRENRWFDVRIDLSPWTVKRFGEQPDQNMLDALIEGGWPITDEDRKGWDEWFEYQKEFD